MSSSPVLQIENVSAGYGGIKAVRGVTLAVSSGQIVALVGANGAGKTSLLRAATGLLTVSSGRVVLHGRDITGLRTEERVRLGMTLVPERRELFAGMSVHDNLELGAFALRRAPGAHDRMVTQRLQLQQQFPVLATDGRKRAGALSGGQQQQLAIARALMAAPTLMLLDEPSFGLSPILAQQVFRTLRELADAGLAVVIVEQNAELALRYSDRISIMQTGAIIAEGSAAELRGTTVLQAAYLGRQTPA